MHADSMASGACTSGSTALPRGATRAACGGAAMTSTTRIERSRGSSCLQDACTRRSQMRKLIAGMKTSVDAKIEGPEGVADWVEAWSNDYDLMPQIDACLLGANMYPGYEGYWTAVQNE